MATPLRVLIAEDNEDHRFLTTRALQNGTRPIEIDEVTDGVEALDYLHRRGPYADQARPHLILLDLKMPKLGGLDVLERLKQDDELKRIPVVVLTSSDRDEDVAEAYRLGGNSYVTKPAGPDVVERLLELSSYWTRVASLPDTVP